MTSSQVFCNIRQQLKINKIADTKAKLEAKVFQIESKGHAIQQKALLAENLINSH
ncbi:MAG: hypothetical protein ACJAS1_005845 [Oleiphilaceae bacterium]|jgi:hypothetical protein